MTIHSMGKLAIRYCGSDSNGFYDRNGEYFRAGVDPRNYYGRLVPDNDPEPLLFGNNAHWTDDEKREYLRKIMDSRRDILNATNAINNAP